MRLVFLYSELMPDRVAVFRMLVKLYAAEVHVVYWDHHGRKTPYTMDAIDGVTLYKRSEYGFARIYQLLGTVNPDAIYVVGWMDHTYLPEL